MIDPVNLVTEIGFCHSANIVFGKGSSAVVLVNNWMALIFQQEDDRKKKRQFSLSLQNEKAGQEIAVRFSMLVTR